MARHKHATEATTLISGPSRFDAMQRWRGCHGVCPSVPQQQHRTIVDLATATVWLRISDDANGPCVWVYTPGGLPTILCPRCSAGSCDPTLSMSSPRKLSCHDRVCQAFIPSVA